MLRAKCLMILGVLLFTEFCNAKYYNSVLIDGYKIHFEKGNKGSVDVDNTSKGNVFSCEIIVWNDRLSSGSENISITSDGEAIIIYPGNKYLMIDDIKNCRNERLELKSVKFFDDDISSLVDIKFDKKLVLALVVIDASLNSYQAILSHFNGGANILTGKGFWQGIDKAENGVDDFFLIGDDFYVGKISKNGKYVSPND